MAVRNRKESGTAERILDIAERLMQTRGFNNFSYADIATELGITKASLHYHYPGKAELGQALITRYTSGSTKRWPTSIETSPTRARSSRPTWTCMPASCERADVHVRHPRRGVPDAARTRCNGEVIGFFDENQRWLAGLLKAGDDRGNAKFTGRPEDVAQGILSTLEGAMLVARPYGDLARFDAAAGQLMAGLTTERAPQLLGRERRVRGLRTDAGRARRRPHWRSPPASRSRRPRRFPWPRAGCGGGVWTNAVAIGGTSTAPSTPYSANEAFRQLSVVVMYRLLGQHGAQSLYRAAEHLALGEQRVDDRPGVVDRREPPHVRRAGVARRSRTTAAYAPEPNTSRTRSAPRPRAPRRPRPSRRCGRPRADPAAPGADELLGRGSPAAAPHAASPAPGSARSRAPAPSRPSPPSGSRTCRRPGSRRTEARRRRDRSPAARPRSARTSSRGPGRAASSRCARSRARRSSTATRALSQLPPARSTYIATPVPTSGLAPGRSAARAHDRGTRS